MAKAKPRTAAQKPGREASPRRISARPSRARRPRAEAATKSRAEGARPRRGKPKPRQSGDQRPSQTEAKPAIRASRGALRANATANGGSASRRGHAPTPTARQARTPPRTRGCVPTADAPTSARRVAWSRSSTTSSRSHALRRFLDDDRRADATVQQGQIALGSAQLMLLPIAREHRGGAEVKELLDLVLVALGVVPRARPAFTRRSSCATRSRRSATIAIAIAQLIALVPADASAPSCGSTSRARTPSSVTRPRCCVALRRRARRGRDRARRSAATTTSPPIATTRSCSSCLDGAPPPRDPGRRHAARRAPSASALDSLLATLAGVRRARSSSTRRRALDAGARGRARAARSSCRTTTARCSRSPTA